MLLNNGNGTFATKIDYAGGGGSVTIGDFNGDGKPDLAGANVGGANVLLNNGNGTFGKEIHFATQDRAGSVTTGDFNGDGMSDLAVTSGDSNSVRVLLNTTGTQPVPTSPGLAASPGQTITLLSPRFSWNAAGTASEYGLYISKLQTGGTYAQVFDSTTYPVTIPGNANSFQLPAGILVDGGQYRWNMSTKINGVWGALSGLLYFKVKTGSQIRVVKDTDNIHADITIDGGSLQQWPIASLPSVFGTTLNDTLTLDFSNGNPLPSSGFSFDGGPGFNIVTIIGTPGDDTLTASANGLTFTGGTFSNIPITTVNVQSLQFHGGSGGNDSINLTGGIYTIDADTPTGTPNVSVTVGPTAIANFATDQHLANLTLNGGTANLSSTRHSMVVNGLAISNNGLLDIANSFLYLNNTATSFAAVKSYLDTAYNLHGLGNLNVPYAGDYKGVTGITSSVAKASYATDEVIGLGYYNGALQDPTNPDTVGQILGPDSNSGHGTGIALNQILIRPTLTGDLNGDGVVNSYDVGLFNSYGLFNTGPTALGWQAGDLNGDGVVDSKDVTIFNTVGNFNTGQYAVATAGARVASALSVNAATSGGTAIPAVLNQSRGVAAVAVAVQPARSGKVAVNHHRSAQKHSARSHVSRVFSALARLGRH